MDTLSVDRSKIILERNVPELWRSGKQTITAEEDEIWGWKFKTRIGIRDIAEVNISGENGKKCYFYEIEMKNGGGGRMKIAKQSKSQRSRLKLWGRKLGLDLIIWIGCLVAGISPEDYGYVNFIFTKETSWTTARNEEYAGPRSDEYK